MPAATETSAAEARDSAVGGMRAAGAQLMLHTCDVMFCRAAVLASDWQLDSAVAACAPQVGRDGCDVALTGAALQSEWAATSSWHLR